MAVSSEKPDTVIEAKTQLPKGVREGSLAALPHQPDMELAALCVELCSLTYRSTIRQATAASYREARNRTIQRAHIYGYEVELFSTGDQQGGIFYNRDKIFVAFEGSLPDQISHYDRNLISYLRFKYAEAPKRLGGFVHYGFDSALNQPLVHDKQHTLYDGMREKLEEIRSRHPKAKLYFTGHSAGGAIAEIMLAREYDRDPTFQIDGLYTFGQPRAGNRLFKDAMDRKIKDRYFRFEQYGDPMPALPPRDLKRVYGEYVHGGQWIPMDSFGRVLDVDVDQGFKIEDTLSRRDPSLYGRGVAMYNWLLGRSIDATREARAISGTDSDAAANADVSVIEHALRDAPSATKSVSHELPDTFSGLMNLMFPKNFYAHSLRSYRNGILRHLTQHPEQTHAPAIAEQQAQHLLWRLINLEEHLQQAHGALSDWKGQAVDPSEHGKMIGAITDCLGDITPVLSGWDDLRADPEKHLQAGLPAFYYLKVWSSPPDRRITSERADFVKHVQDEARHDRIDIAYQALEKLAASLQSLNFSGRSHEELRLLEDDVSECMDAAKDVLQAARGTSRHSAAAVVGATPSASGCRV